MVLDTVPSSYLSCQWDILCHFQHAVCYFCAIHRKQEAFSCCPDPTQARGWLPFHQPSCLCSHSWDGGVYVLSRTHWPLYSPSLSLISQATPGEMPFLGAVNPAFMNLASFYAHSALLSLWLRLVYLPKTAMEDFLHVLVDSSPDVSSEPTVSLRLWYKARHPMQI